MKRCKNSRCKSELPINCGPGRPQEYCKECYEKRHDEQRRRLAREYRKKHSIKPSYFKHEINWDIENECSNCGAKTQNNVTLDEFHGEAVCKTCGLIVGTLNI